MRIQIVLGDRPSSWGGRAEPSARNRSAAPAGGRVKVRSGASPCAASGLEAPLPGGATRDRRSTEPVTQLHSSWLSSHQQSPSHSASNNSPVGRLFIFTFTSSHKAAVRAAHRRDPDLTTRRKSSPASNAGEGSTVFSMTDPPIIDKPNNI